MNSQIKHTQDMMDHFFGEKDTKPLQKCHGCFRGFKSLDHDDLCLSCAREQRELDKQDNDWR